MVAHPRFNVALTSHYHRTNVTPDLIRGPAAFALCLMNSGIPGQARDGEVG